MPKVFKGQVARLWGMSTLRNISFMSFSTTIPYWFHQRGLSDADTALALSVYSFAATAGAFLGGGLSDRLGRKRILKVTILLTLPIYLLLIFIAPEARWLYLPLLALAGIVMNAGIPVAVVMTQEHQPDHIATVSGLMMGFTWGFAGLFYAFIGPLVEHFGVLPTMLALSLLLLPAIWLTFSIKEVSNQQALLSG
ncbi:MAG: MFS transporter [Deinococcales bacterium]